MPSRALPVLALAAVIPLGACGVFGSPPAVGEAIEGDAATVTVTAVEQADAAELGLAGVLGTSLSGVPWIATFQVDATEGEPPAWDVVLPDLEDEAVWTARTSSTLKVPASPVSAPIESWCPGVTVDRTEATSAVISCQLFVIPEGQTVTSVSLDDVGRWAVDAD